MGCSKRLTEKDLETIVNLHPFDARTINLQVDEFTFNQISTDTYNVCKAEDGIGCFHEDSKYTLNFFKGMEERESIVEQERDVIASVGDFISENGIESIGYTDSYPFWDEWHLLEKIMEKMFWIVFKNMGFQ